MQQDDGLIEAAPAVYETCYTAAPVGFDEARQRGLLYYRRALEAAQRALVAAGTRAPAMV